MITIEGTDNKKFIVRLLDEAGEKIYCFDNIAEVTDFVKNYYSDDIAF